MVLFLGTDVINKKSLQDNLASCFYNHNELDLRNGFFREEVEWSLSGPCTSTPSKRKKYVCKHKHKQKVAQKFHKCKQNANINLYTLNW